MAFLNKILCLFAVLLAISLPVRGNPFRKTPEGQYFVSRGRDLTLPCMTEKRDVSCSWIRGRTIKIPGSESGRYQYNPSPKNGDCSLTITSLTFPTDNQTFECQVTTMDLDKWPKTEVVVLVKPDAPLIKGMDFSPIVGDQLSSIKCESKGGNPLPTLDWFLNNEKITQNSSSIVKDDIVESTLNYTFNKKNNASTLVCKSTHPEGDQSLSRTLNVHYKPIVTVDQSIYTVTEGDNLEINCQIDANPPAEPIWKPDAEFDQSLYRINESKLLFTNINQQLDQAGFQCSAKNSIGPSVPVSIRLNVLYQPRLVLAPSTDPIKLELGKDQSLTCQFNGNPKPAVRWNFIDSIYSKQHLNINSKSKTPATLDLKNITYLNEGEYYCEGINSNSITNKDFIVRSNQFRMDVIGAPLFLTEETTVYGYENSNTRIDINFCSDPPPTEAVWFYDNLPRHEVEIQKNFRKKYDGNLESIEKLSEDSGRITAAPLISFPSYNQVDEDFCFKAVLSIRNTDQTDAKEYILKVKNERGTSEKIIKLLVASKLSGAMLVTIGLILLIMLFLLTVLFILFLRRRANKRSDVDFEDKSDVRVPINDDSDDAKQIDEKVL